MVILGMLLAGVVAAMNYWAYRVGVSEGELHAGQTIQRWLGEPMCTSEWCKAHNAKVHGMIEHEFVKERWKE